MKHLLITFFLLCFVISPIFGFQQLSPVLEKYKSEEKATAAMEEFAYTGDFASAIEIGTSLKEVAQKQNKQGLLCFINQELLLFYVLREDLGVEQKEQTIETFHKKSKEKNDPNIEQVCQAGLAHLMVYTGQFERFDNYYKQAIRIAEQQKDYRTIRNLNVNIATEYLFLSEWKKAEFYLNKAEDAFAKETVKRTNIELGTFHNARSVIYYNLSEYDKALSSALYNIYALESSEKDETIALMYDYNNLAGIYRALGELENSFIYHQKALELLPKTTSYPLSEQAVLYHNVASFYQEKNHISNSTTYAKKALSTIAQIKDQSENKEQIHYIKGKSYLLIARNYYKKSFLDSCTYYLNKTKEQLFDSPILYSDYYHQQAKITYYKKQYKVTEATLLKALNQVVKDYGKKSSRLSQIHAFLGLIKVHLNHPKQALYHYQNALEAVSINFSDAHGYSNPTIENVINKKVVIETLSQKIAALSALYNKQGNTELKQAMFTTTQFATQLLEKLNQTFKNPNTKRRWLQEKAVPLFEASIASALAIAEKTGNKQYIKEAFLLSERSKSMLMLDMLQEQQAALAGGVPDSLIRQLENIKRALYVAEKKRFDAISAQAVGSDKEIKNKIFQLNKKLNILKRNFETNYPKYYNLRYNNKQVSLEALQKALEPETVLLEFFEGKQNIYIFSVYTDSLAVHSFKKTEGYSNLFQRFSESLIKVEKFLSEPVETYNTFAEDAFVLYQYLIAPVNLKGIERIIIVPDGELSYLPFEVLLSDRVNPVQDKENAIAANFAQLPYLLHKVSTNYNYSGRLWLERNILEKRTVNNNILALAPHYNKEELPTWRGHREVHLRKKLASLPGAFNEVEELKKRYVGDYYSAHKATETLLKREAPKYGILHLAMHGLVNVKNPEFSGLALAEDRSREEDNFLYAYEIEQLPICASLVVLSACETGIGKYQPGEGVASIGRSFIYAGAASLLMTLWNLNDHSSVAIISEFYKNLEEGLKKDEAIRQAKLHFLKKYPQEYAHPFLWAPFIQVGSYEAISIASKNNYWWFSCLFGIISIFSLLYLKNKMW